MFGCTRIARWIRIAMLASWLFQSSAPAALQAQGDGIGAAALQPD